MRTTDERGPTAAEVQEKLKAHQADLCQGQTAMREKYWSELSIEEKIERTRETVQRQGRQQERLGHDLRLAVQTIHMLSAQLRVHRHTVDNGGEVTVPMPDGSRVGYGDGASTLDQKCLGDRNVVDPDKVYF